MRLPLGSGRPLLRSWRPPPNIPAAVGVAIVRRCFPFGASGTGMAGAPELRYFEIQLLQLDPGAVVSLGLAESGGALALLAHGLHPGWHSGPWAGSTQASRGAHCRRAAPAARAEVPAACCCTASCACLERPPLSLRLPGALAHESRPCTAAACLLPLPVERAPLPLSLSLSWPRSRSAGTATAGSTLPAPVQLASSRRAPGTARAERSAALGAPAPSSAAASTSTGAALSSHWTANWSGSQRRRPPRKGCAREAAEAAVAVAVRGLPATATGAACRCR
jgi:hypothetical protein